MAASSQWVGVNYSILLITFLAILDFIDGVHISSHQNNTHNTHTHLPVKGNTRISLKYSTFYELEFSPGGARTHDFSITYRVPLLVMSQIIKARHLKYISIYQDLQEIVYENDKNMNWICPMTAVLNFTICGETASFTAWHTADLDSAQNIHIETTNEVLFLKYANRSLFRAIFQFFVLTNRDR